MGADNLTTGATTFFIDPYRNATSCGDPSLRDFTAGSKITAKSPSGRLYKQTLDPRGFQAADISTPNGIEPGVWEISGSETAGIYYFQWHVPVNPIRSLSIEDGAAISQKRDFKVSWDSTGYKTGDKVFAAFGVDRRNSAVIYCSADAADGQFTISAADLTTLGAGESNLPAQLFFGLSTSSETRTGEIKSGQTFRTTIGGYFDAVRNFTLQ